MVNSVVMVKQAKLDFGIDSIFHNLVPLKQTDDDTNFEPLHAKKSQPQVGITIRQPYLTIPKYGQYGQKMDFPTDFIFGKYCFLERTRDDKNFELLYAPISQVLADLALKITISDQS